MGNRKRLFFIGGAILLVVLSVQLLLPYERGLPFARAFGESVAFTSHNDLASQFQTDFESAKVELISGSRSATTSLPKLGATVNSERMAQELSDYPLWQRLIPFSVLFKQPSISQYDIDMSGMKMKEVIAKFASDLTYPPTDASFSISNGKLNLVAAKDGYTVTPDAVRGTLITAVYDKEKTQLRIAGTTKKPARGDADVQEAKTRAQAALERKITLSVEGKGEFSPDAAIIASWLVAKLDVMPATIDVNRDEVKRYVESINAKVQTAPTVTTVAMVDNTEKSRTQGVAGASLNVDAATDSLAALVLDSSKPSTLVVGFEPVASPVRYTRSYSHSLTGLQAYVAYATSTQNVRIVVQQLDGNGWGASGRASESIPSASTYKLYVLLRAFDEINAGRLNWDTPMLDTTAGGCFERTVVVSTNPCAEEWIRQFGRNALTDYVHEKGFSNGTGFTFSDATHTTAGDLAKYLIGLNNGTLVNGNNRTMLLEKMGRQLYRGGIPAGVPDARVEDKVGFLWDYIHDAAIVHKPQGSYVLVVMTKGYSYSYIANVARQIDDILYP